MSSTIPDLSNEFSGRRALVTGGSRGIGAAIAQRFLDAGATVVVTSRSPAETTPEGATYIAGDVRTDDGAKAIATEALAALGGIDILVNNAGAARVYLGGTETIPDQEWQDSLDINFLSAVRVTNALLPALKESAAGVIINISSGGGAQPLPAPLLHYGAAKAALNVYTWSLAQELAPIRIRVNTVTPGPVISPGGDEIREVFTEAMGLTAEQFFASVPLGRGGEAHEVAEQVALLASDRGQWMTGHNYFVDGGQAAF